MPTWNPCPDFGTNDLPPRSRRRIFAGLLLDVSEVVKWATQVAVVKWGPDETYVDDGTDDQAARLDLKKEILKQEGLDFVTVNAKGMVTEDNGVPRNPIMLVTQKRFGKFMNMWCTDCEQVTDTKLIEDLGLKPGPLEEKFEKILEERGIKHEGFQVYFY